MTNRHDGLTGTLVAKQPFQLGYVTTDLDEAIGHYARELNAPDFAVSESVLSVQSQRGPLELQIKLALAYVGDMMIELIEPVSGDIGFYTAPLPETGFGLRLHHLGFRVDGSEGDWTAFRGRVADEHVVFERRGAPSFFYLDTVQALGHHLEYISWTAGQFATLNARLPRN